MKLAVLLTTPRRTGGAETFAHQLVSGLRSLGHDVDVVATTYRKYETKADLLEMNWPQSAVDLCTHVVRATKPADLEKALIDYDGIIVNHLFFVDKTLPAVLYTSEKIAPWTSGCHTNMSLPGDVYSHLQLSPRWTGKHVYFWDGVPEAHAAAKWYRTILPYELSVDAPAALNSRLYDFMSASRVAPEKGLATYLAGLTGLRDRGYGLKALLAGESSDMIGGPHSFALAQCLGKWGWDVRLDDYAKMKTLWQAHSDKCTITYSGKYDIADRSGILSSGKFFVNTTSGHAANSHFEYATLEAIDNGCVPICKADWNDWQYPDEKPRVFNLPSKSHRLTKKNGVKTHNNMSKTALVDVYDKVPAVFENAITLDNETAEALVPYNRDIIEKAHDPRLAASTFIEVFEDYKAGR